MPLYTVVADGATPAARAWALPYVARYPEAFRAHIHLGGAITAGSVVLRRRGHRRPRHREDWPGYDGFYIVRHVLTVVTRAA